MSETAARHSRVTSSTMLSTRNLLPQGTWSRTKSSDHRALGFGLDEDRRTRAGGTTYSFPPTNRKPFLAIEPIDAVDARRLSLPPEQDAAGHPEGCIAFRSMQRKINHTWGG